MEYDLFKNLRALFVDDNLNTESYTGGYDSEGDIIKHSLKNLVNQNLQQNISYPTYNPNYIPTREELLYTETNQNGGQVIKGLRYENNLNNVNEDSSELSNISSEMYGGRKNKPTASDALHQESVDYLKNDLKLSPLEARAYKALAYRYIKEKNPDASGQERSKLMISLIKSDNFLDEFKEKLDETMKIIENIDSEKEKTKLTSEPEKKKKIKSNN